MTPIWKQIALLQNPAKRKQMMAGLARFFLCLPLVLTPWLWGTTEAWSIRFVEGLCLWAVLCVLVQLAVERRLPTPFPRLHFLLTVVVAGIVVAQWLRPVTMELFAGGMLYRLPEGATRWPFTVAPGVTADWGFRWGTWILFGWALWAHPRNPQEVRSILKVLVWNAVILAVVGITQYLSGTDRLLWLRKPRHLCTLFGPFVYHNNFAAYVNLLFPAAMGLALLPGLRPSRRDLSMDRPNSSAPLAGQIFWSMGAGLILASVSLAYSSSGSIVAGLTLGLVLLDAWLRRRKANHGSEPNEKGSAVKDWRLPVLVLLAGGFLLLGGNLSKVLMRFERAAVDAPGRTLVYEACWYASKTSPAWGYGLGSFTSVYPFYRQAEVRDLYYEYAHSDWVELLLEFGWAGGIPVALWALASVAYPLRERWNRTSPIRRSLGSVLAIGVFGCLIHAAMDFPLKIASIQLTWVALVALGAVGARQFSQSQKPDAS